MKKLLLWLISFVVFLGCGIAYAQSRPGAPQIGFGVLRVFDVTQVPLILLYGAVNKYVAGNLG